MNFGGWELGLVGLLALLFLAKKSAAKPQTPRRLADQPKVEIDPQANFQKANTHYTTGATGKAPQR